jgi:hypothetical protein
VACRWPAAMSQTGTGERVTRLVAALSSAASLTKVATSSSTTSLSCPRWWCGRPAGSTGCPGLSGDRCLAADRRSTPAGPRGIRRRTGGGIPLHRSVATPGLRSRLSAQIATDVLAPPLWSALRSACACPRRLPIQAERATPSTRARHTEHESTTHRAREHDTREG